MLLIGFIWDFIPQHFLLQFLFCLQPLTRIFPENLIEAHWSDCLQYWVNDFSVEENCTQISNGEMICTTQDFQLLNSSTFGPIEQILIQQIIFPEGYWYARNTLLKLCKLTFRLESCLALLSIFNGRIC